MRKFILIILILSFGLLSFINSKKAIGLYGGKCKNGFYTCSQILLKQDSNFEYGVFMDFGGWEYWKGKWKQKGDTIILNTFEQPNGKINTELIDSSINGTSIKLSLDSLKYDKIIIKINNDELVDTLGCNKGLFVPNTIVVKKIAIINLIKKEDGILLFGNFKNKKIEIFTLVASNFYEQKKYMTNEKWLLKGNNLYYHRDNKGVYDLYYKRISMKNKAFTIGG